MPDFRLWENPAMNENDRRAYTDALEHLQCTTIKKAKGGTSE